MRQNHFLLICPMKDRSWVLFPISVISDLKKIARICRRSWFKFEERITIGNKSRTLAKKAGCLDNLPSNLFRGPYVIINCRRKP